MGRVGFSTGALAKGDFRAGIELQRSHPELRALELSALRDHELPGLARAIPHLDVASFDYISIHAPSRLSTLSEDEVFEQLFALPDHWPIIVHPELIRTPDLWRRLGSRLCLENMDNRKSTGRTLAEVRDLFEQMPDAEFCLDLGHARQIDPTMATAVRMAKEFGPRLRQLHVSEVGSRGEHLPLSVLGIYAMQQVAPHIPDRCAVIIESVVAPDAISQEADKVIALFCSAQSEGTSFKHAMALAG